MADLRIGPARWTALASILMAPVLLSAAVIASATSPCPPLSYTVTESSPLCVITLTQDAGLTLTQVWWQPLRANATWVQASQHVGRTATATEPVTYLDNDNNSLVSASDKLEVWNGCGGDLPIGFGASADSLGGTQTLHLTNGFSLTCGGTPTDWVTPTVVTLAVLLGVGVFATVFLVLRRRILL